MNGLLDRLKNRAAEAGVAKNKCAVKGCDGNDPRLVTLKPLDPIDHPVTTRVFCADHYEWARERNQLAERIKAELVEKRKELGEEHYEEIQRLAAPNGDVADEILMGEYDSVAEYEADQ